MAVMKIDDKFTSSISDTYSNDSDFIQNIVLSGHTSYTSLMAVADSDGISAWNTIKDSCAGILNTATYSNFDQANQTIVRSVEWPADSDYDLSYYDNYREKLQMLNANGAFRTTPYVRRMLRMGVFRESDGNNWGAS